MISRLKGWLILSISDVFFVSVLLYLALPGDKGNLLGDGDTGYHIRAGDFILNNLSVPKSDIFSYITPMPWTAHEWLSEVIMALLHKTGGLTSVLILFAFIIAVSTRIFFKNIRADGNNVLLSVVACIAFVALAKIHWLARPHIFSLLILIGWYQILDDFQYRHKNRLWILPLTMLLWVNLHGGFVIGLAILGIYLVGNCVLLYTDKEQWELTGKEKSLSLGKILGASIIACIANPIGYQIFLFPFKLVSNKYIMDNVIEFLSPNFHEIQPFKYLLLLSIIIFAYSKRKPNIIEITLTVLFTSMSLFSVRYIPLFGVIVIPILLRYIECDALSGFKNIERFFRQRIENISSVDDMASGFLWPTLCIFALIFFAANGSIAHSFNPEKKPMAAIEFLKKNPVEGNMFNNDEFGDCIIYANHQKYKVFIDGRSDMYGTEQLKEYDRIYKFETGWEHVVEKYKITWIFFGTDTVLSRYLIINNDWKLIYSDKVASIFVKNIPLYKPLIDKYSKVTLFDVSADASKDKL